MQITEATFAAEGLCSPIFRQFATTLAGRAALAATLDPTATVPPGRPFKIAKLVSRHAMWLDGIDSERSRDAALASLERRGALQGQAEALRTEQMLSLQVSRNRLEWMRVDLERLSFKDEPAAREAMFCVKRRRPDPEDVALDSHQTVRDHAEILERLEPELRDAVLSASVDEVIGPTLIGERFEIAMLVGKKAGRPRGFARPRPGRRSRHRKPDLESHPQPRPLGPITRRARRRRSSCSFSRPIGARSRCAKLRARAASSTGVPAQTDMVSDRGVLGDLPILRFLPDDARALVVRRFVPSSFPFGTVIAAEGHPDRRALRARLGPGPRGQKGRDGGEEIPLNVLARRRQLRRSRTARRQAAADDGAREQRTSWRCGSTPSEFRALVDAHPDIRTYLELQLKHATLQRFFRNVPAFNRLPPEADGRRRARGARTRSCSGRGRHRVSAGRPAGPLYLIEEGRLRVVARRRRPRRCTSRTSAEGESFGVVSALRRTPHTTSVEAMTPVRLLTLSGDTLESLGEALPAFRSMLDDRVAQYEYRDIAAVPADIDQEILPASTTVTRRSATRRSINPAGAVDEAPGRRPVRRRRILHQARPAAAASRSSSRSTRWTAARRAWRWSRARSAAASAWRASGS